MTSNDVTSCRCDKIVLTSLLLCWRAPSRANAQLFMSRILTQSHHSNTNQNLARTILDASHRRQRRDDPVDSDDGMMATARHPHLSLFYSALK